MSDLLQSRRYMDDQHPDADQLNAFAEQALPEHERLETLAHLVECADCREIVALALPPFEDAAMVEDVAPAASPSFADRIAALFSSWNVIWIAAPALAALVLLTLHIRNLPKDRHPDAQVAGAQVAGAHAPSQPAPPPRGTEVERSSVPKAAPAKTFERKRMPRASAEAERIEDLPVSGRNVVPNGSESAQEGRSSLPGSGRPSAMKTAPARADQASGGSIPAKGSTAGVGGNMGGVAAAPRAPGATPGDGSPSVSTAPAPYAAAVAKAPIAAQPALDQRLLRQGLSPRAPDQPVAPVVAGNAAVSAGQAPNTLTTPTSAYAPLPTALPSGQPVLSLATNLHRRVALDVRNQLFLSEDDGMHWRSVAAAWQGRALTVASIPVTLQSPPAKQPALALAVPERFTRGAMAAEQPEVEPVSSLSGAVVDASGAAIPNATIVATDSQTTFIRTVKTDTAGRYRVDELPPGVYRLQAQAAGFLKQSQTAVVTPSQQAVTNLVLAVAQGSQTVAVEAARPQLEVSSRTLPAAAAKAGAAVPASPAKKLASTFVLTTEAGETWTSADGQTWKH